MINLEQKRINVPYNIAFPVANLINRLPPDLMNPLAVQFDRLPLDPYFTYNFVLNHIRDHLEWHILWESGYKTIPNKAVLSEMSKYQFRKQARIDLAKSRLYFPDIPEVPDLLRDQHDKDLRKLRALLYPHPSYGFPEVWHHREGPGVIKNVSSHISYDYEVSRALYPSLLDPEAFEDLINLVVEVSNSPVEKPEQEIIDKLRFLGLTSENEFIATTERMLLSSIQNSKIQNKTESARRLGRIMDFAKKTDNLRQAPRKTGESYYCHYLGSAWILWNMLKPDLKSEEYFKEATEDTEIMLIHDLKEDFRTTISKIDSNTYRFKIEGMEDSIDLSYDQVLILRAITKEKHDDGSLWLHNIRFIHDERLNDPSRDQKLKKRASRCKTADRFSNLLTMTLTGDSYLEMSRKLEETELSGKQLMVDALLSGVPPFVALQRWQELSSKNSLKAILAGIPIIAKMERRILHVEFGRQFMEGLLELDKPWTTRLKQTLDKIGYPLWQRRYNDLSNCYYLPQSAQEHIVPATYLNEHYGLKNAVAAKSNEQPILYNFGSTQTRPYSFGDFESYINGVLRFSSRMVPTMGVLPGGADDLFVPVDIMDKQPLFH